jgi:TDG/mug DNA glycosylase family protein
MMLRDRVRPPLAALFVGINPGLRSAETGHHFAGYSNRFWKLLYDAGLVPERIGPEDDVRLPEWGYGLTNLVPRATAGIGELTREDYIAGERSLRRKVRRWQPGIVALVGVTLYRTMFRSPLGRERAGSRRDLPTRTIVCGLQPDELEGSRVFVLPNPSGRNANFTYAEMLEAYRGLRRAIGRHTRFLY